MDEGLSFSALRGRYSELDNTSIRRVYTHLEEPPTVFLPSVCLTLGEFAAAHLLQRREQRRGRKRPGDGGGECRRAGPERGAGPL